jgi:hypothetical protein
MERKKGWSSLPPSRRRGSEATSVRTRRGRSSLHRTVNAVKGTKRCNSAAMEPQQTIGNAGAVVAAPLGGTGAQRLRDQDFSNFGATQMTALLTVASDGSSTFHWCCSVRESRAVMLRGRRHRTVGWRPLRIGRAPVFAGRPICSCAHSGGREAVNCSIAESAFLDGRSAERGQGREGSSSPLHRCIKFRG